MEKGDFPYLGLIHFRISESAIKRNKGDAEGMSWNVRAILNHCSEDVYHDDCPERAKSWCSFNRDKATGQSFYFAIKDPLPSAIVKKIQSLFDCLSSQ